MQEIGNRKRMLQDKIGELETTLGVLKAQLQREIEEEQHAAIDKLEEYLGELNGKHSSLQDFWRMLREEIVSLFSKAEKED